MKKKVSIIGAGPYGISLAYEFWEQGIPFEIIGKPFDLWLHHTMPDMAIRSDRHSSEIYTKSGVFDLTSFIYKEEPLRAESILKDRLPSSLYRKYLQDILDRLPFTVKEEKVTALEKKGNAYFCTTESGESIESENVVIACGIENHRSTPDSLKNDPQVLHTWDVQTQLSSENKKILLIGGGQSAAEAASYFSDANNVTWVMRKSPIFYSEPINLPKPIFKAALLLSPYFYFLPKKVKAYAGKQFVETTITPDLADVLKKDNVSLLCSDAEQLGLTKNDQQVYSKTLRANFDFVMMATGYRYHVRNLPFLTEDIIRNVKTNNGIPEINFDFESSLSGLYFVGGIVEQSYGPAQRFLMGARHVTRKLGKALQ